MTELAGAAVGDLTDVERARHRVAADVGDDGISISSRLDQPLARFYKRTSDILTAIPLALFALLVLPLLAVIVRLDSKGPALFSQERVGRGGRSIRIYKIRTMHADAEDRLRADPELYRLFLENDFKLPDDRDPRITRVGRILRRTSLDELPQVFLILRGTMSAVGPRPIEPEQVHMLYGDRQDVYLSVRPGLTGLWQVSGRSRLRRENRVRLDLEYVQTWSPILDIRLLLRTVPAVLTARGAH
jgi:lipopolysaccharide/colanic/teichoic acid biosynthesis glycosyltransferase